VVAEPAPLIQIKLPGRLSGGIIRVGARRTPEAVGLM
jgi:hypothetical protein